MTLDDVDPAAIAELVNAGYPVDTIDRVIAGAMAMLDASENLARVWLAGRGDLVEL